VVARRGIEPLFLE